MSRLVGGKADGVVAVQISTGSGLELTVLPGRGMDIPFASFEGRSLGFFSGTGITSPSYYEEPGMGWLRSAFFGLLTTCGIVSCGFPGTDGGKPYGLHGRVSNAAAEDVAVVQDWEGDEYVLSVQGKIREACAFGENMMLTRKVETRLGWDKFILRDVIENKGFEPQPLMMIYHFNFGFPLLGPDAEVLGPIVRKEARDEESIKDRGIEDSLRFAEPQPGCLEKVFFYELAADAKGDTFMSLINRDMGDGSPLGIVMRFNSKELPRFTHWKMPGLGFYVTGLEPGTVGPLGRGKEIAGGGCPMLAGQASWPITIGFEVIHDAAAFQALRKEAAALLDSGREKERLSGRTGK
jgi:hypothetical protein